ncbi:MAG TPA: hypothetical protein VK866_00695 [Acidimicrobiales bacterium]|nr:hypothetical protein [Acidimicrobiales bacterium]
MSAASSGHPGLWSSRWPAEDGGPARRQAPGSGAGLGLLPGERLVATSRLAMASTMVVLRDPGEVFLLCHTAGDDAVSWVERIDPHTLEPLARSVDLPGGKTWPGGLAAHANGSLHVVFGRHAHRLTPELEVVASRELPVDRPYNSFVVLPDGHLVTKDFAGARPGAEPDADPAPSELVVLDPDELGIVARLALPEPSIARLSADGDDVYVVGDTSLLRVRWDGAALTLDDGFVAPYRTLPGQTYGWDAVIDAGAAWFLDDGAGSDRYAGSFRGVGVSESPLHLVRVDLATADVTLTEVCGLPGGLIANPPAVDPERRIAVGYDSSNGVVTAFSFDDEGVLSPRWRLEMDHAAHPLRFPDTGELVLCDHDAERGTDQIVVVDIVTGEELARVDSGSPVQSVLFGAPGFERDLYMCTFTTVTRVHVG